MWKCKWEFMAKGKMIQDPTFLWDFGFCWPLNVIIRPTLQYIYSAFFVILELPINLIWKRAAITFFRLSSLLFYKRKSVIHVWVHKLWRSFHFLVNYSLKITLQGWKNQISLLWDAFHMIYWGLSSPDMETACAKSLMYIVTISLCVTAALSVERFFAVSDDFKCHTRRC